MATVIVGMTMAWWGGSTAQDFGPDQPLEVDLAKAQRGRALFDQNCTACHTIGGGVLIGPDLQGVTERREESWLKVHIQSPSIHHAENDPIAIANVKKTGVPMPDPGLTEQQVEAVIAYFKAEELAPATIPTLYLPALAIGVLAIVGFTLVGFIAGRKKVNFTP